MKLVTFESLRASKTKSANSNLKWLNYAIVFWTEDQQYSVLCSSKIHGEVEEGNLTVADWEEGKKGKKTAKTIPYPAKIIKTGGKYVCSYFRNN